MGSRRFGVHSIEMKRRFVVLDRDGTIIHECSYLGDPEQVKLIAGVAEALRRLQQMGLGLAVVTNQSAVGRGLFSEERLNEIHRRLVEILNSEGVHLDGLYYCPHKPEDECWCRKPSIGLMKKASEELSFDLRESFVVGDKTSDIEMGRRAGAVTILVRTGYGTQAAADVSAAPDHVVRDLAEAAEKIAALLEGRR
jgi:D-glycero-D-manno-heptose 1,7-bisphosphate phosphatase